MTRLWLLVIGLALTCPMAMRLGEVQGKPIDIIPSDLFFLLVLMIPRRRRLIVPARLQLKRLVWVRVAAVLFVGYALWLAAMAYTGDSELLRVLSAVKFTKPIVWLLLGTYVARTISPSLLTSRMAQAFSVWALCAVVTQVLRPEFPYGRWGQYMFHWEVYGFPNSAMTFYGAMIPFILGRADLSSSRAGMWFYRGIALVTALIVVGSLSRSSILVMLIGASGYWVLTGRARIPIAGAVCIATIAIADRVFLSSENDSMVVSGLQSRLSARLARTLESDDPLAGRIDLWKDTIALWREKPYFGYAFEPFSIYANHDTPHQQYLEVLYKCGGVGLLLYAWLLISGLAGLRHLMWHDRCGTEAYLLIRALTAAYVATLVGNLSQPNFTSSLTGNAVFFLLGIWLSRPGAASLVRRQVRPAVRAAADGRPLPNGSLALP